MRSTQTVRTTLAAVVASVALGLRRALAQIPTSVPPMPVPLPSSGGSAAAQAGMAIGLVVALVVLLVVLVKVLDLRRKREAEAVGIQSRIADALLRDPALARLPVVVTVHVPIFRETPATAEVRGDVPSQAMREAVVRVVREELSRVRPASWVEDRLMVLPVASRYAA